MLVAGLQALPEWHSPAALKGEGGAGLCGSPLSSKKDMLSYRPTISSQRKGGEMAPWVQT